MGQICGRYAADLGQIYWGCLYDESRRNKVLAGPDQAELAKVLNLNGWNEPAFNHVRLLPTIGHGHDRDFLESQDVTEPVVRDEGIVQWQFSRPRIAEDSIDTEFGKHVQKNVYTSGAHVLVQNKKQGE